MLTKKNVKYLLTSLIQPLSVSLLLASGVYYNKKLQIGTFFWSKHQNSILCPENSSGIPITRDRRAFDAGVFFGNISNICVIPVKIL
jgi:hypothetical protein